MPRLDEKDADTAIDTQVLVVGAGPIGLIAALDLASRGIDVVVVERAPYDSPVVPKANHISARSMEIFRRLGIAAELRAQGLPDDFPNDVAFVTSLSGYELGRLLVPSRNDRYKPTGFVDSGWPTPEPAHRCNQIYFEPVIRRAVDRTPGVRTLYETEITEYVESDDGVTATGRTSDGKEVTFNAQYLIGCEGARSMTRQAIGAKFEGIELFSRNRTILVRAPDLIKQMTVGPAWMTYFVTPIGHGLVHAIDGTELWSFNLTLNEGETDLENYDHDPLIRAGMGADISYETVFALSWIGRRLIADKFSKGRAFIAGDSAHVWMPTAGYGMNAGIADVCNLTWKIAAVLNGWADTAILPTYGEERIPVTQQVSEYATMLAQRNNSADLRTRTPPELFETGPVGDEARAVASEFLIRTNTELVNSIGLNFAATYESSSIVVREADTPLSPPFAIGEYTPSTLPGGRLPHVFLADGTSLYDRLGPEFTLVRVDPAIDVEPILAAASQRGLPLELLDISSDEATALYDYPLVLARPDQHIAWRGRAAPKDASAIIDAVRGAAGKLEESSGDRATGSENRSYLNE